MISNREQALTIAKRAREDLVPLYGDRLKGVYMYGSCARDEITEDSDLDLAVVLDRVPDRFAEYERVSVIMSELSLDTGIEVNFFPVSEKDYTEEQYRIHHAIKCEGIPI